MRILVGPNDFLDGRYRFLAGERYDIPDRKSYVVANGWATELPDDDIESFTIVTRDEMSADAPRAAADGVTLEVQDSIHATDAPGV